MFGPSSGVVLELRRIILNKNPALYRSWMVPHHGHILAKQLSRILTNIEDGN